VVAAAASTLKFRSSSTGSERQVIAAATTIFSHAAAPKAPLYRAILHVVMEAKQRYVFQLRPQEIIDSVAMAEPAAVHAALAQLCAWGNLETGPDDADVRVVEEFYEPRQVFRITPQGEAAERAFAAFSAEGECSEPQHTSLAELRQELETLNQLSQEADPAAGKINRSLIVLRHQVETLSATAQDFIERLDRRKDLPPPEARRLIDFGQRFIGELVLETDAIAGLIRDIESRSLCTMVRVVPRLRGWFMAEPGLPSQSEILRERARAPMIGLLRVLANTHHHQAQRMDRVQDFRTLARWFAEAPSDAEAHRLWRAAFGLHGARHLTIDDATLDDRDNQSIPPHTSWLEAPPLRVARRARDYRGQTQTGGLSRIIDRTGEKRKLAAALRDDAQRLLNAQRRFGTGNRMRLSELAQLEPEDFEMFLDLLGDAVAARVFPAEAVEIVSGDGCLKVQLEPTADGRQAEIRTPDGTFSGPDHWIRVEAISGDADEAGDDAIAEEMIEVLQ
jgi:hypothetical protein